MFKTVLYKNNNDYVILNFNCSEPLRGFTKLATTLNKMAPKTLLLI